MKKVKPFMQSDLVYQNKKTSTPNRDISAIS
jgi:hypothetical protein